MAFRRSYFNGQFSKQISVNEPLFKTILYSLIPSIIFLYPDSLLFQLMFQTELSLVGILDLNNSAQSGNVKLAEYFGVAKNQKDFMIFFGFTGFMTAFNYGLGVLFYWIVRALKLDIRLKILRFKNNWAYIFSGEACDFRSFSLKSIKENRSHVHEFTYLDVLVRKNDADNVLYTGVLIDYEVNPQDISKLERVFLSKATRYGKSNDGGVVEKTIPGDFIVIEGENIINVNVRYKWGEVQKVFINRFNKLLRYYKYVVFALLTFVVPVLILFPLEFLRVNNFFTHLYAVPLLSRILIVLVVLQCIALLVPIKEKREEDGDEIIAKHYFIGKKEFFARVLGVVAFSSMLYTFHNFLVKIIIPFF